MKKQAGKKLKLSTETLRALPSTEIEQAAGGMTTAITCGCSLRICTTAPTCGATALCTVA